MRSKVRLMMAAGLSAAAVAPAAAQTASITGVLSDLRTRDPVANASIIVNRSVHLMSDAAGVFRLEHVEWGTHVLEIRRLGYAPIAEQIFVPADSSLVLAIPMEPLPPRLADLNVEGSVAAYAGLEGFHERARQGRGHFLTRDDIRERRPQVLSDVLRRVPGVRTYRNGRGQLTVGFANGRCSRPRIVMDGLPLNVNSENLAVIDVPIDNMVAPDQVAAIEVYVRDALVPAEYRTPGSGCGAIVIWTR